MTVYRNRQGSGLFIVFKYIDGELDTGSYTGSYARKPPARTYNTPGQAKAQWNRFIKDGYGARAAEIGFDESGQPFIRFIDEEWTPTVELCKYSKYGKTCKLKKDHEGIHQ
ncbi:hypothetical protein SEA_NICHOLAS_83 [Mycobacterium phage Nicholas]|uniref:Uncharacterized protein n=1 Tax=Mycobacterium phage Lolly9 TaxID=1698711 RepID=A0A0K2FN15_9CAUD|nr:hypothetical protein AVU99_gp096 [Mycobacterium phage Lolly9]ASR87011.1 hypothetical protein SEA_KINGSOLOMON_83 [Mycobacterium phage Kingsolomon]ASR87354.1 hypothetical protein SEA_NICHOLAS_83 [Mycobacterium phage Nicholas]AYB70437.1 hypothetical protein SEA_SAMTY_84 [Mycobacterium phage Samty]QDK03615.1 hypothetical protein SEA_FINNRY_85 [Mycobacterium phage Finnry]QOP65813.1 hypothetical protein PBI_MINILON_89 [Mycobacterium phage MiniLon]QOP66560.1 hypothetical protein PBI_MINIMAC_89 [M